MFQNQSYPPLIESHSTSKNPNNQVTAHMFRETKIKAMKQLIPNPNQTNSDISKVK